MSETSTETLDVGNLICGLKAAVTALECQHKMETKKKQMITKRHQKTAFPPMYMMIPIEEDNSHCTKKSKKTCQEKCEKKSETKSILSCASSIKEKNVAKMRAKKPSNEEEDKCAFVGPEMRGGVLYNRCDCIFRNGLQDDCPLTLCQAQPDCLAKPWAECSPAKYYRARHPDIYIAPPNPSALTL